MILQIGWGYFLTFDLKKNYNYILLEIIFNLNKKFIMKPS